MVSEMSAGTENRGGGLAATGVTGSGREGRVGVVITKSLLEAALGGAGKLEMHDRRDGPIKGGCAVTVESAALARRARSSSVFSSMVGEGFCAGACRECSSG